MYLFPSSEEVRLQVSMRQNLVQDRKLPFVELNPRLTHICWVFVICTIYQKKIIEKFRYLIYSWVFYLMELYMHSHVPWIEITSFHFHLISFFKKLLQSALQCKCATIFDSHLSNHTLSTDSHDYLIRSKSCHTFFWQNPAYYFIKPNL